MFTAQKATTRTGGKGREGTGEVQEGGRKEKKECHEEHYHQDGTPPLRDVEEQGMSHIESRAR